MAKNDKLAQQQSSKLAPASSSIPEYLRRQEGTGTAGMEGMDRSDMKVPRLSLCQSMTGQRSRTNPKWIEGLEEGQFFNTITGKIFGEKLKFVPLLWYKSRILFLPLDEGGGILCRSENAIVGIGDPGGKCTPCPMAQWTRSEAGGKRQPPRCTLFHNYAALVLEEDRLPTPEDMLVISFKSTGLDAATDLNALINLRGAKAAYAGIYELSSAPDSNASGQDYFIPVVKNAGWVSQDMAVIAQGAYDSVKGLKDSGKLEVDEFIPDDPGSAQEL